MLPHARVFRTTPLIARSTRSSNSWPPSPRRCLQSADVLSHSLQASATHNLRLGAPPSATGWGTTLVSQPRNSQPTTGKEERTGKKKEDITQLYFLPLTLRCLFNRQGRHPVQEKFQAPKASSGKKLQTSGRLQLANRPTCHHHWNPVLTQPPCPREAFRLPHVTPSLRVREGNQTGSMRRFSEQPTTTHQT